MPDAPVVLLPNVQILLGKRLYEPLINLAMVLDAQLVSFILLLGQDPKFGSVRIFSTKLLTAPFDIQIETANAVISLHKDIFPPSISIKGRIRNEADKGSWNTKGIKATMQVIEDLTAAIFIKFYETYYPFVRAHLPEDVDKRDELYLFTRAVRNAAAHSGRVSWPKAEEKRRPVTWRNITLSRDMHDKRLIGPLMNFGDLIMLMMDFDGFLEGLGCSHPRDSYTVNLLQ